MVILSTINMSNFQRFSV